MRSLKGLLFSALFVTAALAQADIVYSDVTATITFQNEDTFDLDVDDNGFELDFSAGEIPLYVASANTPYTQALIHISYTADSDEGITGLGLIFHGWAVGNGVVAYEENVFDDQDTLIASVGGAFGGDTPFVQNDFLDFEGSYKSYRVEKFFFLSIFGLPQIETLGAVEGPSLATIGLIEQNAVPEPATMAALAFGSLGLLARRRRSRI